MKEVTNDEENSIFQACLLDHSSGHTINERNERGHCGAQRHVKKYSKVK